MKTGEVKSFANGAAFRQWLEKNHAQASELTLSLYKKGSASKGITYAEALDEALCYGWIDGVRRSVDASSYTIRFSPRKPRSIWSHVNIGHVARLRKAGRMLPAGLKAYEARDDSRVGIYSFENKPRELSPADEALFRGSAAAWEFFQGQAPSYQRVAIWYVTTAKMETTRARRLKRLIDDSAHKRRIKEALSKQ